jgi:hypothetical protein
MEAGTMQTIRKSLGVAVLGVLLAGGVATVAMEHEQNVIPLPAGDQRSGQALDPMIVEHDRSQAYAPVVEHDRNQAGVPVVEHDRNQA